MEVAAAVVVGAVLLIAGISKLVDVAGWREESRGLGVVWPLAAPVPAVELVLGALLVTQVQRSWTAWGATALVAAFTVLVVVHLLRGRRPPCACFGALSRRPLGWGTVVRNLVLCALAVVAAVG